MDDDVIGDEVPVIEAFVPTETAEGEIVETGSGTLDAVDDEDTEASAMAEHNVEDADIVGDDESDPHAGGDHGAPAASGAFDDMIAGAVAAAVVRAADQHGFHTCHAS